MGELEIASTLLAHGADADAAAAGGDTPHGLATQRGESAVLALFAESSKR